MADSVSRLHCLHGNIASLLLREGEKEGKRGGDFHSDVTSALFILCPRVLAVCGDVPTVVHLFVRSDGGDWLKGVTEVKPVQ